MRKIALRAALAAVIAGPAAAGAPPDAEAAPGCPVDPAPDDEASIAKTINRTRASQGVPAVDHEADVRAAARRWSMRMARTGAFVHSRLEWARGRRAGENIAMAPTPRQAVQVQMDSPPHRRNILARAWDSVGVGVADRCGTLFVTVNFMRKGR